MSDSIVSVNENLSYTTFEELGEGATSTVYKGTFNEEDVAVKRMKKKLTDDYKKLLRTIKHENIVLVLCIERCIDIDHIVLELCLASLYQYFKEFQKVMNKFDGLTVVKKDVNQDAVRGLEYLHKHEKGIVHRDIKPGNILLVQKSSSSEVKAVLADFGISTKLNNRNSVTTLERRGTDTWMAPELLLDDRRACKFSRESDIFSMGCVIYYVETGGNHPFDKGHDDDYTIHENVKNYDPCDFRLLDGKPIATALIRKMIELERASRPSASEVLDDCYFKGDGPQDTIQVPQPQLTNGGEAPQGDTPQDISVVHDEASTSSLEQSVSADGKGHASSTPPPEQSVTDTSYGKQLYDAMVNMSDSLPRYIVDHYIRLLAIINVKCNVKHDWLLSKKFLELYSTHVSKQSPQVAASYVYKILTGLGYEEMEDFRAYLYTEVEIDTRITEELKRITKFRPAVIEVVSDELGPRLRDYQVERYRMVLTILCVTAFDSNKSFFELFTDLTGTFKYPLAVALTIGVLETSHWRDTTKLKPFSLPNFDLNTSYPKVDLCLTVANYYGNMSQRDFRNAKTLTSSHHLKSHNMSNMSGVQFTLLLMERGVIAVGDVSKIKNELYPTFFDHYEQKCKGPSKETAPTTSETVPIQETKAQATSALSETIIPTKQQLHLTEVLKNPKAADQELPFPHNLLKNIKIVLMTATQEELKGVYKHLDPLDGQNECIEAFIPYDQKEKERVFLGKYGQYPVVVGMSAPARNKQGPLSATHVARTIIEVVKPDYVIAIGICYGMDRIKSSLCDIAVSSMICDFTCLKVESEGQDKTKIKLEPRGNMPSVGNTLLNVFSSPLDFKMPRPHSDDTEEVKVLCGPFIARPDLINDPKYKEELKRLRPDAIAGEMEGAGIMAAVENATDVKAIIIKAISDWADGTKDDTRDWKPFACDAAAKYVHHQMEKENNALKSKKNQEIK